MPKTLTGVATEVKKAEKAEKAQREARLMFAARMFAYAVDGMYSDNLTESQRSRNLRDARAELLAAAKEVK